MSKLRELVVRRFLYVGVILAGVWGRAMAEGFSIMAVPDSVASRMDGVSYRMGCPVEIGSLRYLKVLHYDAGGRVKEGELVCHESIAHELLEIFEELYAAQYPIEKMRLVDDYGGDDEASMGDNNSSCFNFRPIAGSSKISRHAYGMAVDINPRYNPQVRLGKNGVLRVSPANGRPYATGRTGKNPYELTKGDAAWKAFTRRGYRWGGAWRRSKDYQHFDKAPVEKR